MKYLQWFSWSVSLPMQALLLHALARGGFRSFPFLFLYVILLFLWTVANIAAREAGRMPVDWHMAYWVVELVLQGLLYCLVFSLVGRALRASPRLPRILRTLALLVVVYWLAAFLATREDRVNTWMTDFAKYVSFGGAILNLAVWAMLVGGRHKDRSLLMISGGYGVQSAGEAISHSLRALAVQSRSMPLIVTGNTIAVLTHALCLWIWWRAVVHENSLRARGAADGL